VKVFSFFQILFSFFSIFFLTQISKIEGASVLDAMKLLVEHKVHRIYVAKKEGKVGVVTFTDIIDTILIGSFTEILSAMPVG